MDILFKNDDFVFSYRVGGILKHNGKILLQRPKNDDYAIIGGHVAAMETSMETLKREFEEELHAKIEVDNLLGVFSMINKKQFKSSIFLGFIITLVYVIRLYLKGKLAFVSVLLSLNLWYLPLILLLLYYFIVSSSIYLFFRVLNYVVNMFR